MAAMSNPDVAALPARRRRIDDADNGDGGFLRHPRTGARDRRDGRRPRK
jgi:hypothetical protein